MLREELCRQREQELQRPWHQKALREFEKQKRGQCSWHIVINREYDGGEFVEVDRIHVIESCTLRSMDLFLKH